MSCLFLLCCMFWLKLTLFVMLQPSLRSEVARYTFQVWYTLVKLSIFICLYTLWAAAVDYKSSPKNRNPRLCNFSRDCILKIAHGHLCLCVCHSRYPGNTGSLYAHHTLTDNLPRCDDGKKLGSNLIKRLICVKKICVNALKLTPLIYIYIYIYIYTLFFPRTSCDI